MSISFIAAMAAGNAIQVLLSPPEGARRWRVLRKRADTITAVDDAGSNVAYEGDDRFIVDRQSLVNGTIYFYRVFYLVSGAWVASTSRSVSPQSSFEDIAVEAIDVVRDRLDLSFAALVERGLIAHPLGKVPVLLGTPAYEDTVFPLITVHLSSSAPDTRFVGESLGPDTLYPGEGLVGEVSGWLMSQQILIIAWCINSDVRADLRKSLNAVIKANLPIFEAAGMSLMSPSFGDVDDMNTYQSPMYQATCTLSCIAPSAIENKISTVRETQAILTNTLI